MTMLGVASVNHAEVRIAPEPRLVRAAHQFEAMMMKELLAPLSQKSAVFEDGTGEETGVLGQFACESLAGALSAGGGLGIANRIVHELSRSGNASASVPVTGKQESDTALSAHK